MEVNGIVSIEGTDAVPLEGKLLVKIDNENESLAVRVEVENSMKSQELMSFKTDETETKPVAAGDPSFHVDDSTGASTENVETFPQKEDTLESLHPMGSSGSSKNNSDIAENALVSPEKPTAVFSEISNSTPLCLDTDMIDASSLDISTSDSEDHTAEDKNKDNKSITVLPIATTYKFSGSHRGAVVPYSDSEDSESSSSSSSCSDSSDDSDDSDLEKTNSQCSKANVKNCGAIKKTNAEEKTNEILGDLCIEDLPPIEDLQISVQNDQVVVIGNVLHAVESLVVVECFKDQPPLDIDSVLFLDRGARPLGRIFDIIGPVTAPLYCVRFNSKEHIEEQNILPGMPVYMAPQTEHSNFVFLAHLMKMKGSDASWMKDMEVPSAELDFSDDEEEAHTRKNLHSQNVVTPINSDDPKPKAFKADHVQASNVYRPNAPGFQGCPRGETRERLRPKNPWGWAGRNNNPYQPNQFQPSKQQNQFGPRGPVRPSSFNSGSDSRYPNNSQFGADSDSGRDLCQFPTSNCNSLWSSTSQYEHQGNGYGPSNDHMNMSSQLKNNQSAEAQRYHAFKSEIDRLVDAYTRGAESPMTVSPLTYDLRSATPPYGLRPPGPPPHVGIWPPGTPPQFGSRMPGVPPQFASRPPGAPLQFGLRPPGASPQFGSRPSGAPPQFGSRPPGASPQFGSRPSGAPPQFGSRPPGAPPQFNHSVYPGGSQSYENYYYPG